MTTPFDQSTSYIITAISPNGDTKIDNLTLSNIHRDGVVYKGTDTNGIEHIWNCRFETFYNIKIDTVDEINNDPVIPDGGIGYTEDDIKEAERLKMSVKEMLEMYDEMNNYESDDPGHNCEEWPFGGCNGGYEDEGLEESMH